MLQSRPDLKVKIYETFAWFKYEKTDHIIAI